MRTYLPVLISVILSVAVSWVLFKPQTTPIAMTAKSESVYDRVSKSKTLRCGYINWPPLSQKDPNTGKMSGMYIDMTEELARGYGWKVEWAEEISPADMIAALNSGRVDMMCAPFAPVPQRTQWAYFSRSHAYGPLKAFVRVDDKRFDNNPAAINTPEVRISTIEGELTSVLARTGFPKASVTELSIVQGATQLFENVATGKADIVFNDPFTFSAYDANNPGKLRPIVGEDIGFFSSSYVIKFGENEFKYVIDAGLDDLINRRYIEKLAKDYQILDAGVYLTADDFKK